MTASVVDMMGDYARSTPDTLYGFWAVQMPGRIKPVGRCNLLEHAALWDALV